MKKISVVMVLALIWLGAAPGVNANNEYFINLDNEIQLPDAVLFSLTDKYRGYDLISAKQVRRKRSESYRAIIHRNGELLEVAISPNGGIRGEIILDGLLDDYVCENCESYDLKLDKHLKRTLLDNGFSRKDYRKNLDHLYDPERSGRSYYGRNNFAYNPYWGFRSRLYRPRFYRIYRFY